SEGDEFLSIRCKPCRDSRRRLIGVSVDDGTSWEKVLYKIRHHASLPYVPTYLPLPQRESNGEAKESKRRYKEENEEIAVSIRWLAEVVW
ncbi:unnamed protein product, partial [Brassica oleracea var. botrytis]